MVEAEGFNRFVRQGIRIQTAQIARIDISLTVGSVTESITITADAPLLRTENAEQSQTITGDKINSLPIQLSTGPRNPIASVLLAPGVVTTLGSTAVRTSGSQNSTYKILLDGQDITQTGSSTQRITEAQPSVEALQGHSAVQQLRRGYGRVAGGMSYISGALIRVPQAQNNLANFLFRGTYANRVDGEPLFLKDLNGSDVDPNKDFVLNPAAWSDPAPGTWGNFGGYYDDFRQQRRPVEQLGVGRTFRFKERMSFELRGEFFNVFNRTQMGNPEATNALATPRTSATGVPTAGFGRINSAVLAATPGQATFYCAFSSNR